MQTPAVGGSASGKTLLIIFGLIICGALAGLLAWKLLARAKPAAGAENSVALAADVANPAAPAGMMAGVGEPVDMKRYYNCSTTNAIAMGGLRNHPNNLAAFPTGAVVLGGINFQVDGMIQLGNRYATRMTGMAIGAKARWIHLLHGTAGFEEDGVEIATLVLHYDNEMPAELPIQYGVHVRDWWMWKKGELPHSDQGSVVVWQGENEYSAAKNCRIRVYATSFTNPKPEATITAVSYNRAATAVKTTPFLLGLTLDGAPPESRPPLPKPER